jgi:hypothetical protein
MAPIVLLAIAILFVLTASALATDSRDGNDWVEHPRP